MPEISRIKGREILDSRGEPTLEVELTLAGGALGRAAVPSGASTGTYEATEGRDGDRRFGGRGVELAVSRVNLDLAGELTGKNFEQTELDETLVALDGTPRKTRLGSNTILGVSLAFAKASAQATGKPLFRYLASLAGNSTVRLPVPLFNIINGGKHAADSTDFQEFMIIPTGATSFKESLRWGAEVYQSLKKILAGEKFSTAVGDEGGFAPALATNERAIELLFAGVTAAGYTPGHDLVAGFDAAASELESGGVYNLPRDGATLSSDGLIRLYESWARKYPLALIEDGLGEDDWAGWTALTASLGRDLLLVGDDLFTTNLNRLTTGIEKKAGNTLLIKPNQIGTLTETLAAAKAARAAGYKLIVSHRSGETEDTFIAQLAVGLGAEGLKAGAPARGERTAKYNELLRIEEILGPDGTFAGPVFRL